MQKKKFNLVESVQKYLDETPKEQIQKDIEEVTNLKCEGDTAYEYFEKVNTLFSYFIIGIDVASNENDKSVVTVVNQFGELYHSDKTAEELLEDLSENYNIIKCTPTFNIHNSERLKMLDEEIRNIVINNSLLEYHKELQKNMLRFKW